MNTQTVSIGSALNMRTTLTAILGDFPHALSPRRQIKIMSLETYHLLAHTLSIRFPATPVHCRSDRTITPNSLPLECNAVFFEYVIVDSKHFYASWTVSWNKSSFVHVVIPGPFLKDAYGEVLEILQINQDIRKTGYPMLLARMQWLKPWCGKRDHIWNTL